MIVFLKIHGAGDLIAAEVPSLPPIGSIVCWEGVSYKVLVIRIAAVPPGSAAEGLAGGIILEVMRAVSQEEPK